MPTLNGPAPGAPVALATGKAASVITLAPALVTLDWLTVNMLAPEGADVLPWQPPAPCFWDNETDTNSQHWRRYVTEPTNLRTGQFRNVCYLNDLLGAKVATIWSDPHNAALHNPAWVQVQFANHTLYSGELVALFRMFRELGCEYTAISRVDVACDGIAGQGGDWDQVLQMADMGRARYYGKGDWLRRGSRRQTIGGEFGTRASNKFIRAYRKKREMKAKGVKPHIVEAWLNAFGFDAYAADGVEVNRFEVQLKGKEIRRYFHDESRADWLEGLANVGQRVDVFASMAVGMFDFRTPTKYARDAVPVTAWDWSCVHAGVQTVARASRTLAIGPHTIKTGLRSMFFVAHVTCDPSGYAACERLAAAAGDLFVEWYRAKRLEWVREFAKIEAARDGRTLDVFRNLREGAPGADFGGNA